MGKGFLSYYRDRTQFTYLSFWKLQCLKALCLALPNELATLFYPGFDYLGHKESKNGHLSSLFLPSSKVILHLSLFLLTFYVKGHSAPDFSNFIPTTLPWPLLSPMFPRIGLREINETHSCMRKDSKYCLTCSKTYANAIWYWTKEVSLWLQHSVKISITKGLQKRKPEGRKVTYLLLPLGLQGKGPETAGMLEIPPIEEEIWGWNSFKKWIGRK